jgi:regulatory protein
VTVAGRGGQTGRQDTAEARLEHALELAYRHLGFRDRTVAEIRRHLEGKGVTEATIADAVAELVALGYLDDARFAQRYAEDRRALDRWGAERIERRLAAAGVPAALIAAALATQDADAEHEAALAVLRRRFPTPPADDRARKRALGLLVRRGYGLELAYAAIRAHERDGDSDSAGDGDDDGAGA